ncbi:hypothetical protein ACVCH0_01440 [Burkholderia glumae]
MARGGEPGVRHAAMLTPQQARFASALQAGRRVSQQGLQQADDEALAAGIAASLAAMPEDGRGQPAEPQASLQSRVDSALDAGARVSQQALERAYDPELQAAIAESLRPAGSGGASEQAAFRARVDSALDAGVKVSQQALERAYGPAPAASRSPARPLPSATAGAAAGGPRAAAVVCECVGQLCGVAFEPVAGGIVGHVDERVLGAAVAAHPVFGGAGR